MRITVFVFLLFLTSVTAGILGDTVNLVKSSYLPKNAVHLFNETEGVEQDPTCDADPLLPQDTNEVYESSYEVKSPATLVDDRTLGSDMGETQITDGEHRIQVLTKIEEARSYMEDVVMVEEKYEKVRGICTNKDSSCAFWSVLGECDNNPAYMKVNCAPVCNSCEQLHVETRCPMDPNAVDALYPGDLNKMFERIVSDPWYQQYQPVVLSRPSYAPGDTPQNASYKIGIWLVAFENVLSDEEAGRMIDLGGIEGYQRSSDVGEEQADGTFSAEVNTGRTSTNAWCTGACYEDPTAKRLMERIENITGIPETNSENLQLLRYEQKQFYQSHNDYIPYQRERPTGVRILTFYFYLTDVEEGGETDFPVSGLTVTPKKGRAVLWPSVYDAHPNVNDRRSDHQAKPVNRGVKYGANAWIHQRDFKGPNSRGCS